jgi:hypothetical protein
MDNFKQIVTEPICFSCKHLNVLNVDTFTCKAFKDGIPIQIINGENNHNKPFKGDNDIQFEPIKN